MPPRLSVAPQLSESGTAPAEQCNLLQAVVRCILAVQYNGEGCVGDVLLVQADKPGSLTVIFRCFVYTQDRVLKYFIGLLTTVFNN
jgi:hypothetical protein